MNTMNDNGKKNHEIFEMWVCVGSVSMCARALQLAGAVVLKANLYTLHVVGFFFRI